MPETSIEVPVVATNEPPPPAAPQSEPLHLCGLACPVTHAMTSPPVFGDPEMTLRAVAQTMAGERIGALVLIREDGPSSIVTERDVVDALAAGADPDSEWAVEASSAELLTLDDSDTVADAVRLMVEEGVRHLPVRRSGEIIGMVSARDLLFAVASLLSPLLS